MARSRIERIATEVRIANKADRQIERYGERAAVMPQKTVKRYGQICALLTLAVMAHEHEPITVHGEALTREEWSRWITAYAAVRLLTM